MQEQRITVAVRIRPTLQKERYEPVCARKADDDQTIIIKPDENNVNMGETAAFQFDSVFDEADDQRAVYENCVQELVDNALSGFNSTVFTYGQTGSGKTFTILGHMAPDGVVCEQSGMFLRVFDDLFTYRKAVKKRVHLVIALSALELYVDEVMDLLASKKKLKLRETTEDTLTMGINTVEVRTMQDVVDYFQVANGFRSVAATKMNDTSSRSHALFFIDLFQIPVERCIEPLPLSRLLDENGVPISNAAHGLTRSRMALVDLAGSERVKRSGVVGQAMTEAQAINKSLSTLGTVINAMYIQNPHIPFRESKLTKLLKPSFIDPTSRLLLIGQVAPPTNSASESVGTLRFCDRVKGLKAGQVVGFADPEEEARFLLSKKKIEELTAEMHILAVKHYYQPRNLHALAELRGVPKKQIMEAVTAELQAGASDLEAAMERKELQNLILEAQKKRDEEVEQFVLRMNAMIEDYEVVARAVKKMNKAAKKEKEEQEAVQEEWLQQAKSAKKLRLKLKEAVAEISSQVAEAASTLERIETEMGGTANSDAVASQEEAGDATTDATNAVEEATHALVESFHKHATDLSHLYLTYVSRLGATGRQRTQVRRMKLMSSTLVSEGTLLFDILAFLVDRSVDIAHGDVPMRQRWTWHDIDGLSCQILQGNQWWPPLNTEVILRPNASPCEEEYHAISFLSSDESDDENSHHAAETRGKWNKNRCGPLCIPMQDNSDNGEEDEKNLSTGDDVLEEPHTPGVQRNAWMPSGGTPKENGNQEESGTGTPPRPEKRKKSKKHRKKNTQQNGEEEAGEGDPPVNEQGDDLAAEDQAIGEDAEGVSHKKKKKNSKSSSKEDKDEMDRRYLMQVYDSATLVRDLLRFLKGGTIMVKHGRSGKPHRRLFWISVGRGKKELLWADPGVRNTDRSSIQLDTVSFIHMGCFSKVFKRYPVHIQDPAFFRCFTLGLKNGSRTIDIVAETLPDFEAWVVGLSHLIGVDPVWGSKLDVTKEKDFDQLTFFEVGLCESNYLRPSTYLILKRRVQEIGIRTLEVLEECGNDAAKAQKILHCIRLPAVNDRGAVLMSKGELRFLVPELALDIFRVSRIWMLFQQMNLIYDDNFTPATAFGVTQLA